MSSLHTATLDPLTIAPATASGDQLGRQVSRVLLAAFTLSAVHTVYAAIAGIADPAFTVDTPLAWAFYAVGFTAAVVAPRASRTVQWAVAAYLVVLLAISVFVYPTTFVPARQTVFGWFENDVYVALLGLALYLDVLRLRGWALAPGTTSSAARARRHAPRDRARP